MPASGGMSQENQKTSLWDLMTKNTAPQERRDRLLRGQARARLGTRDGSRFAATPRQGANRAMPINAIELASPQSIAGQMLHRKMGGSRRPVWVNDRDRGTPRGAAPPTPPGIRVTYLGGSTGLSFNLQCKIASLQPGFRLLPSPRPVRPQARQWLRLHPSLSVPGPALAGCSAAVRS